MRAITPRAHPRKINRHGTTQVVARIKLPFGSGKYDYKVLGPWGEHYEAETRVVAEWKASRQSGSIGAPKSIVSVGVIVDRYIAYARDYYKARPIGENDKKKFASQYHKVAKALSYPFRLYKQLPAEEFGPLCLEACRELMIDDELTRKYINKLVGCIQRAWKWASSKQLVTANCYSWLLTVDHLKKTRTKAKEGRGTPPTVPWEIIQQTIDHCPRTIGAMIQVQYHCCMRPEEVCIIRKGNIDRDPNVKGIPAGMWAFYPGIFKGDHLENTIIQEIIPIGPKTRAVIEPFMNEAKFDTDYLFSPIKTQEEELARKRALRKTKVQPSQINRKKRKPKKSPGVHYTPNSYRQAVHRAIARGKLPKWSPAQLRHSHSTEIRDKYDGINTAQLSLRHKHAKTSEIYAKIQVRKAFELMAKEG